MSNGFEIDFLPVGEGERCGDAITLRWREGDRYRVMVYDGGTADYGAKLVTHIRKYFGTDHVDYVVNSHPDNDHAGGLSHVVNTMSVGEVWLHRPWEYSSQILQYFHDGRITDASLAERLQEKMSAAHDLEQAARKRSIPVNEPFAGSKIGIFTVLSPMKDRYVHDLIPAFEKSPKLAQESLAKAAVDYGRKAFQFVADKWDVEYLPDSVATSAENESSAILFGSYNEHGILLTGDAGIESLKAAADFATNLGIHLPSVVTFVQIPHHGGRHNMSTSSLNILIGEPRPLNHETRKRSAYASASAKAPSHPKRVVTNAFIRRGFNVAQTKGRSIRYSKNMPARADYSKLNYLPFYDEVEG